MGRVKLRAVRPDGRSKDLSLTMNTTLQEVVAPWQQGKPSCHGKKTSRLNFNWRGIFFGN